MKSNSLRKILKAVVAIIISFIIFATAVVVGFNWEKIFTTIGITTSSIPQKSYYINSIEELNSVFDTQSISINDVYQLIKESENSSEIKSLLNEFVKDNNKVYPNQNWWIFYQNLKKIKFEKETEYSEGFPPNFSALFTPSTCTIKYSATLDEEKLKIAIRHELTHSKYRIDTKVDNYTINIKFADYNSDYGRSVYEMLTSLENSYCGNYDDNGYINERFLFQPLIEEVGTKEITDTLNENIYTFINLCKPYYSDIEDFIVCVDTYYDFLYSTDKNADLNKDFIDKLSTMSIDLFLQVKSYQLENNKISFKDYQKEAEEFKTGLYKTLTIKKSATTNVITATQINTLFADMQNKALENINF